MVQQYYSNIISKPRRGQPTIAEARQDYARHLAARYGANPLGR